MNCRNQELGFSIGKATLTSGGTTYTKRCGLLAACIEPDSRMLLLRLRCSFAAHSAALGTDGLEGAAAGFLPTAWNA
jgi:hypothetical protein